MARRVFYSFHFKPDFARTNQVRNIGALEGNKPVNGNEWEQVKRKGDDAVHQWIREQMVGKSCAVVLIGAETSTRPFVQYEIEHAWSERKGVVGVYIHNLKDLNGEKSTRGKNPFDLFVVGKDRVPMSSVVSAIDPPFTESKSVYAHIAANLDTWVEAAIRARNNFA